MSSPGPYSIGSNHWPGLSKLIEESGEVGQIVGKLIATGGKFEHWDGSNLRDRLQEELGDLMAACKFVMEANSLDENAINTRTAEKLTLFHRWHVEQADSVPPSQSFGTECACGVCMKCKIGNETLVGKLEELPSGVLIERLLDGTINNCALACGEPISSCQMCPGECPDAARFKRST